MKKRYITIAILCLTVILVFVYLSTRNTTFNEAVLDELNISEISSLEIIKSIGTQEEEISVVDSNEIKSLMSMFSQIKLKHKQFPNGNYSETYWITIKGKGNRLYGMTLYDKDYIQIYNYQSNISDEYKIIGDLNLSVIQEMFN